MPKVTKQPTTNSRTLPYPHTATPPNMPSYHPTTPPPTNRDGHNSTGSWSPGNDDLLVKARQQGLNWQPIASQYFPDKTANACRKRHERLMEKRNHADSWEGPKMEALSKAYNEMREQMWRILADKLGEKWQTVEAKCMEKGVKNLQNIARSTSRRDQANPNRTLPDNDNLSDSFPPHDRFSHRSRSHSHDVFPEVFNDNGLVADLTNSPLARAGSRLGEDDQQQAPYSAGGLTNSSSRRSYTPNRTFSNSTSSMSLPSTTPTMAAPPQFPFSLNTSPTTLSSQHPPLAAPQGQDHRQTLPSFSTTFSRLPIVPGLPSVLASSLQQQRHQPNRAPVTTH